MDIHAINHAYERLANAEIGRFSAAMQLAEVEADLNRKKAIGLADGTIGGKNADERAANAAKILPAEHAALEHWQRVEGERRLELDLARIDVERLRMILRAEELHLREPLPAITGGSINELRTWEPPLPF